MKEFIIQTNNININRPESNLPIQDILFIVITNSAKYLIYKTLKRIMFI